MRIDFSPPQPAAHSPLGSAKDAEGPTDTLEKPQETIERFRDGDADAIACVVRAYTPMMWRIANRFWNTTLEIEDMVQEIWLHVVEKRRAVDPQRWNEFEQWLGTVAYRRCLELARSSRSRMRLNGGIDESVAPQPEGSPSDAVTEREVSDAVRSFKSKLRPAWATFFELHFAQGLEYREVANRLGISVLRCKYMKKVLAIKARRDKRLLEALDRPSTKGRVT